MRSRGIFTISIDVEAAWGRCDVPLTEIDQERLRRERAIVDRLLALFAVYEIRATWAVVGHLLEGSCGWDGMRPHPEISRPVLIGEARDWLFQHPGQGTHEDPLWYGRDLVERIRNAVPAQEIGSHSYCHLPYDERRTARAAVTSDLFAAARLHRVNELPFHSFIFPRNVVGYTDLLAISGIACYRGKTPVWYDRLPVRPLRRFLHLASYFVPVTPPTVRPSRDAHGLMNIPDSMLLMARHGPRRFISPRSLIRKAIRGLDRAVRTGEVFHLWFHPSNFAERTDEQFRVLETILRHVQCLRADGQLRVKAMEDFLEGDPVAANEREAVEGIRRRAVEAHEQSAEAFREWYDVMRRDPFASAFAYGRLRVEDCLRRALEPLPSDSRVLDVGCGTGEQLRTCQQWGYQVAGVEPSPSMRAIARQSNPGIEILDGAIGALPFPDASFDAVIAVEVLRYLHARDIGQAYREMLRVVKPGGRLFFTMVNRYAMDGFYLYERFARRFRRNPEAQAHCEFVTPRQVEQDLRRLGVTQVELVGRLVLPIRLVYKLYEPVGARIARRLHPLEQWLSRRRWTTPLSGHLIVTAVRPSGRAGVGQRQPNRQQRIAQEVG